MRYSAELPFCLFFTAGVGFFLNILQGFFEHFGKNWIHQKCNKLDFSRNFVTFGGHFGTKHPDFHLELTNFGCEQEKLDFKGQ